MSSVRGAYAAIADAVEAHIEGEKLAKLAISEIERGTARPDSLEHMLKAVTAAWGRPGLAGAARTLQKHLEQAR